MAASAFIEFRQQPCLGEAPGPLDGAFGEAEHFGDFAIFQAGEEAELDDLGFGGVLNRQPVERFIHLQQLLAVMVVGEVETLEGNPHLTAAVADLLLAAGMVNEDATHALGGSAKEVRTVVPGLVRRSNQPQPGFVDKRCGLQRVAGRLAGHPVRGKDPQLLINNREQLSGRLGILLGALEDVRNVAQWPILLNITILSNAEKR